MFAATATLVHTYTPVCSCSDCTTTQCLALVGLTVIMIGTLVGMLWLLTSMIDAL